MKAFPRDIPFSDIWKEFVTEYAQCRSYWYTPKARVLSESNVLVFKRILEVILNEFLGQKWNRDTQDALLHYLINEHILDPYYPNSTLGNRTALTRIIKVVLSVLGLLWIEHNAEIIITDAGLDLIAATDQSANAVVAAQVAKLQYPNPSIKTDYMNDFEGLLPHLFLLQVLEQCNFYVTNQEFELFVNLSQSHDDLPRIVRYIHTWRDVNEAHRDQILRHVKTIPLAQRATQLALIPNSRPTKTRYLRIAQNASYQRSFFAFPEYLAIHDDQIQSNADADIHLLIAERLKDLKVPTFENQQEWFNYLGDTSQQPSWFTFLSLKIERANTSAEVETLIQENKDKLSEPQVAEIKQKQIEKGIETFYADNLSLLEEGLELVENGRQYITPIGRIDLLCRNQNEYVVVEIKANAAEDAVFGQILRYIGWIHRNFADGNDNVRGIILASQFPETARYSRIGLLRDDYQRFIKFKEHGLNVSDS